jgi:hypothetical protein
MGVDFSDTQALLKKVEDGTLLPTELAIETVFGCNAKCTMCFIDEDTSRSKEVMKMDLFKYIVDAMEPYKSNIEKFDMWCLGEPLLDPYIVERVDYAKKRGFPHMAIATNADLMSADKQDGLLEAGIDTIIVSIDGARAETHEKIRRGLSFDNIVTNCESVIQKRDKGGYQTRFLFRFIDQENNKGEWPEFSTKWSKLLDSAKLDNVGLYPEHNWGGYMGDKTELLGDRYSIEVEKRPCFYVFESLLILADGTLTLCPADFLEGQFGLGKVPGMSPIEAFNSDEYKRHRRLHLLGEKNQVKLCETCTILYSNDASDYVWEQKPHTFELAS